MSKRVTLVQQGQHTGWVILNTLIWQQPPSPLVLSTGDVHIWKGSLSQAQPLSLFSQTLSSDELEKAQRAMNPKRRDQALLSRLMLREVLSHYLRCAPHELIFEKGPHGKPYLATAFTDEPLFFNVSHSHERAVVIVSRNDEVGIDIERVQPRENLNRLSTRYFSPNEHAQFMALPESERLSSFYRIWTRKEAYIKGIGAGLTQSLSSFEVSLEDVDSTVECLLSGHSPESDQAWSVFPLELNEPNYVAAIGVNCNHLNINHYLWLPG